MALPWLAAKSTKTAGFDPDTLQGRSRWRVSALGRTFWAQWPLTGAFELEKKRPFLRDKKVIRSGRITFRDSSFRWTGLNLRCFRMTSMEFISLSRVIFRFSASENCALSLFALLLSKSKCDFEFSILVLWTRLIVVMPGGLAAQTPHQWGQWTWKEFCLLQDGERSAYGFEAVGVGDQNLDGCDDYLVGAPFASPNGVAEAGSAFLFSGRDCALLHVFEGTESMAHLRRGLASAGDLDFDGIPEILFGEPMATASRGTDSGRVYVYTGGIFSPYVNFNMLDGQLPRERFGTSIASILDANNDGIRDIVVGARDASPNQVLMAGAVYVFSGADRSMLCQLLGTTADGQLGRDVADAGDVDMDGAGDFIAGTYKDSQGSEESGSAVIYSVKNRRSLITLNPNTLAQLGIVVQDFDWLGHAVSGLGDLNEDG